VVLEEDGTTAREILEQKLRVQPTHHRKAALCIQDKQLLAYHTVRLNSCLISFWQQLQCWACSTTAWVHKPEQFQLCVMFELVENPKSKPSEFESGIGNQREGHDTISSLRV
jgi:hypothetical protein